MAVPQPLPSVPVNAMVETARLILRLPAAADARPLMDIHEHPDAIKFVATGPARRGIIGAWSNVATMLGHWHLRGYGQWTVVDKSSDEIVGRVGLWNPEGWPGVELGWIIHPARWNNGLATEASKAALEWAWANAPIDHIISLIQPVNSASIRVAEKIGERLERRDVINGEEMCVYAVRRR